VAKYTIKNDIDECIGCAACAAICSNWEMVEVNGDEKAKPLKTEIDDSELEDNKEAAESCPVEAIHIVDKETGKKII